MFMGNGRALFHLRCRENLVGHRGVSGYYGADCGLLVRGFREAHIRQFHGHIGLFGAVGGAYGHCGFFLASDWPFRGCGGLVGCVYNRELGTCASASEVYPAGKLQ